MRREQVCVRVERKPEVDEEDHHQRGDPSNDRDVEVGQPPDRCDPRDPRQRRDEPDDDPHDLGRDRDHDRRGQGPPEGAGGMEQVPGEDVNVERRQDAVHPCSARSRSQPDR